MGRELAFVLINPYTIAKSRTGGVIARVLGRTDLNVVAARMFGPSRELAEKYAALARHGDWEQKATTGLIADYILRAYTPDPATGKPRRVMLLLFEGEDAVAKIWRVTGSATLRSGSGETIRDTYGDYVADSQNRVQYFEPAVLVGPTRARASSTLSLWARYSARDGGLIEAAADVPTGTQVEKTLVMLKPDNFRYPSARAGNIIDILSASGLRIVGVKKFRMRVSEAEEFYGPVREALKSRFAQIGGGRVAETLSKELGFRVPDNVLDAVCRHLAPAFADSQFEDIVKFMTGYRPSECSPKAKASLGSEECLALVYEGVDAVRKIRTILGPTDPTKAQPGSVRREFGSDIMVNAAHASDSVASARREMEIIRVEEDTIKPWVDRYYGGVISRLFAPRPRNTKAVGGLLKKLRQAD
jgi:nucleoside diphosphate kinase